MIERKYSTFWPRFAAGLLDGIILMPAGLIFGFALSHSPWLPVRVVVCLLNSSFALAYSIWMHGKYGQTLGKMSCGVIVLDISEQALTMRQAILRDIFGVIFLPIAWVVDIHDVIYGSDPSSSSEVFPFVAMVTGYSALGLFWIEVITMLTNKKRRALHDFIAGSVVIRKPSAVREPVIAEPSVFRP